MPLEWTSALATGVPEIDEQHKELFARINAFVKAIMEGREAAQAMAVLEFLTDYTHTHFSAEEKLLADNGYPQLAIHKAQHEYFIRNLDSIKVQHAAQGAGKEITGRIHQSVTLWLVNHIQKMDLAWAKYLKSKR